MGGRVFFTSDLHIGHAFVAKMRGFESVEEHDALLAERWDKMVNPKGDRGDQVWVLGDISAGGDRAQKTALAWLMQRSGEKHLIAGNHDGVHPMHRNAYKYQGLYQGVFASIQPFARRRISGHQVLLSHFPFQGDGDHTYEERYAQYRLPDMGLWLLHGHTHSSEKQYRKSIHVGVDAWDFTPVPLDDIQTMIMVDEHQEAYEANEREVV